MRAKTHAVRVTLSALLLGSMGLSMLGLSTAACGRHDGEQHDSGQRNGKQRDKRLDRRVVVPASPLGSAHQAATSVPPPGAGHGDTSPGMTQNVASGQGDAAAAMPGPYRQRMTEAVKRNRACVTCHPQQAAEWRGSHHQIANLNPAYRRAFAIEPTGFCRGCHAPESKFSETPPAEVSALGVACVTCHLAEGDVVLAATLDGEPDALVGAGLVGAGPVGGAPHPLRRSQAFAHTGGCASCHEFRFPGRRGHDDGQFMQTTVREHQRSPAANKGCASCHMPRVGGRRSHAFAQVRDDSWLRQNLTAKAERKGGALLVTLEQPMPGHAYPSGDLFRRLAVESEWLDASGSTVAKQVRYLARHFEIVGARPGRQLVKDNRVFFRPRVVALELPEASETPARVRWWVRYQRVATVGVGTEPAAAHIESEVVLHKGNLPWQDASRPSP